MDSLAWLQNRYTEQCDGDWEHANGVQIDTLDNPGWSVNINLQDTRYNEVLNAVIVDENVGDSDWIVCRIVDGEKPAAIRLAVHHFDRAALLQDLALVDELIVCAGHGDIAIDLAEVHPRVKLAGSLRQLGQRASDLVMAFRGLGTAQQNRVRFVKRYPRIEVSAFIEDLREGRVGAARVPDHWLVRWE